jgi:hypothetical protein
MIAAETRRADLRLALAVNEDHDGVEREVLDADLDAGHGSIVAGPAVEGTGAAFYQTTQQGTRAEQARMFASYKDSASV